MKYELKCDWCGKTLFRCKSGIKKHNFCSRRCLADFSNKAKNPDGYLSLKDYTNMGKTLTELNRRLNPTRMTLETKKKLREAHLNSGKGLTYTKIYGRHAHRVVAEEMLGRPLLSGEVVHHIDGNKRNNAMENLLVFKSQAEHARYHANLNWFIKELKRIEKEGDAE